MTIDRLRHGRQIRLPEIGEAGQERLVASEVVLSGAGAAREIEAAYLGAAGVTVRDVAGAQDDPTAKARLEALGVSDPAARDVADGAMRALVAMRALLGVGGAGE